MFLPSHISFKTYLNSRNDSISNQARRYLPCAKSNRWYLCSCIELKIIIHYLLTLVEGGQLLGTRSKIRGTESVGNAYCIVAIFTIKEGRLNIREIEGMPGHFSNQKIGFGHAQPNFPGDISQMPILSFY